MFSHCPLRIGVVLFLLAVPYLCDVVSSDELTDNLLAQQGILLETDLDDDKATGVVPSIDIIVGPNIASTSSGCFVVIYASFYNISQTNLAVSGCRPPPLRL